MHPESRLVLGNHADSGHLAASLARERAATHAAAVATASARIAEENAEGALHALRAELAASRQLGEQRVSHVAGIAHVFDSAACQTERRAEDAARASEVQAAQLAAQVQLERQRVESTARLGEAQVSHISSVPVGMC